MWLGTVLIALGAIGAIIPFRFTLLFRFGYLMLMALAVAKGAMWTWRASRTFRRNEACFAPDALRVHLFPEGAGSGEFCLRWEDVCAVTDRGDGFTVSGTDGRSLSFTGYEFFRPARLAREIASRAGKSISRRSHLNP